MAAYVDMESAQFENVNELRKYPFSDGASLVDRSGKELPLGAIADAHFSVSVSNIIYPLDVRLSSFHISKYMLSACFVVGSGESARAMSSIISRKDFKPYSPYMMEVLSGPVDIGGYVSFGDLDFDTDSETYFLDGAFIHPCCVAAYQRPKLVKFVDNRSGETLSGDVRISFSGYVAAHKDGNSFKLSLEDGAESELVSECAKVTGSEACGATPIMSINGVRPDDDGNIVLWFH